MVVAFDGEAKCGKTTIINNVAGEATYQASIIPDLLSGKKGDWPEDVIELARPNLTQFQEGVTFNEIFTISAGNMFRAATHYVISQEEKGQSKSVFDEEDVYTLRKLLDTEGMYDFLQDDPAISSRVSSVAQMAGVQALCGALFCDSVLEAYNAGDGANLVIVDARDPVGRMRRNDIIGEVDGRVHPASILPVYIDTPVEVAARRLGGDTARKVAEIAARRLLDTTRSELPVVRPDDGIDEFDVWLHQFEPGLQTEVARPLYLDNGELFSRENIKYFAGMIAAAAQTVGCFLQQSKATA